MYLLFFGKHNLIDGSIYFSLLFLPIFITMYKVLWYYSFFEFININNPVLKLQVKRKQKI